MKRFLKILSVIGVLLISFWLGKQALPYIAPFLLSFAVAAIMEPAVSAMHRRGVDRGLSAALMTTIILLVSVGLMSCCAVGGAHILTSYAKQAPALLSALTKSMEHVEQSFYTLIRSAPDGLEQDLMSAAQALSEQFSEFPLWLSQLTLDGVTLFAKQSPDWILFVCTAIIGIYFFSAYFQDIVRFFARQCSEDTLQKLRLIRRVAVDAATGYLKVQCILSGVTFLILLVAFHWMGIADPFGAAIGIAIVDALPILGSGAILLPWALIALMLGNVPRGVNLLLIYAVLLVSHNLLQAKLMGSHLGLHPVVALVSLYVGWKLGGLLGMIVLPVGCVLLSGLNRAGIIKLYR